MASENGVYQWCDVEQDTRFCFQRDVRPSSFVDLSTWVANRNTDDERTMNQSTSRRKRRFVISRLHSSSLTINSTYRRSSIQQNRTSQPSRPTRSYPMSRSGRTLTTCSDFKNGQENDHQRSPTPDWTALSYGQWSRMAIISWLIIYQRRMRSQKPSRRNGDRTRRLKRLCFPLSATMRPSKSNKRCRMSSYLYWMTVRKRILPLMIRRRREARVPTTKISNGRSCLRRGEQTYVSWSWSTIFAL